MIDKIGFQSHIPHLKFGVFDYCRTKVHDAHMKNGKRILLISSLRAFRTAPGSFRNITAALSRLSVEEPKNCLILAERAETCAESAETIFN
jgi:hypothetical protein